MNVRRQRVLVKKCSPRSTICLAAEGRIIQIVGGRVVGPVDDQRLADDVLARHEAPVAAVERGVAVVAHREVGVRRHHHLAVHHVVHQHVHGAVVHACRLGSLGKLSR